MISSTDFSKAHTSFVQITKCIHSAIKSVLDLSKLSPCNSWLLTMPVVLGRVFVVHYLFHPSHYSPHLRQVFAEVLVVSIKHLLEETNLFCHTFSDFNSYIRISRCTILCLFQVIRGSKKQVSALTRRGSTNTL